MFLLNMYRSIYPPKKRHFSHSSLLRMHAEFCTSRIKGGPIFVLQKSSKCRSGGNVTTPAFCRMGRATATTSYFLLSFSLHSPPSCFLHCTVMPGFSKHKNNTICTHVYRACDWFTGAAAAHMFPGLHRSQASILVLRTLPPCFPKNAALRRRKPVIYMFTFMMRAGLVTLVVPELGGNGQGMWWPPTFPPATIRLQLRVPPPLCGLLLLLLLPDRSSVLLLEQLLLNIIHLSLRHLATQVRYEFLPFQ